MKRILLSALLFLSILVLLVVFFVNYSLPRLPTAADVIISETIRADVAELKGDQGFAYNGNTKIWYQSIAPPDSIKGSVLLIMGISNDALAWPSYFIDPILAEGYRVIRFDNRGTGLSDWLEDWTKNKAYTLEDMAGDALAVLDDLNIDKAHAIGVSLGGMIAQSLCIQYPDRVHSLTSMMSTADIMDKELPSINANTVKNLVLARAKYAIINSEVNQVRLQIMVRQLLKGDLDYELDLKGIAQAALYNIRKRKGWNHLAFRQQTEATILSGARYGQLKHSKTPTLIIHGTSDPMIHFDHGKKMHEAMPNSDFYGVEGMGHDIPPVLVDQVLDRIFEHFGSMDSEVY